MNVLVFGSINIDLVTTTSRLPIPGETLTGESFFTTPGGKGANQAVALAKLGIPTKMIGRVGNDNFGIELINNLQNSGVKTENILTNENISSGIAVITVDHKGENNIIIIPGANGKINKDDTNRLSHLFTDTKFLLLQLEIPLETVILAAQKASESNIKVILDPAPAQILPSEIYPLIDIITPNEIEASQLVGFTVSEQETAAKAANSLLQKGVKCAIIKLGKKGVYCATQAEQFYIPAFPVNAVDTVAAGDAFNGGLTAGLFAGKTLKEAVVWGAATGALATTKLGAQSSFPDRMTLEQFVIGNYL